MYSLFKHKSNTVPCNRASGPAGCMAISIITNCPSSGNNVILSRGVGSATAMKQLVIELLSYPRYLILSEIDIVECPHHGYYDNTDSGCKQCELGDECQWLFDNEAFIALTRRSVEDLINALDFAVNYTAFQVDNHNARACVCESCDWLREARRFLRQHENEQRAKAPSAKAEVPRHH